MSPGGCYSTHRTLFLHAAELASRLRGTAAHDEGYRIRLGASCLQIAAEKAAQANDWREAVHYWREAALGELQIRSATFHALRKGGIDRSQYDATFDAASLCARVRNVELDLLRFRLRRWSMV